MTPADAATDSGHDAVADFVKSVVDSSSKQTSVVTETVLLALFSPSALRRRIACLCADI